MSADMKARRAFELRLAGVGYESIARRCGYRTPRAAHEAAQRVLADRVPSRELEAARREVLKIAAAQGIRK